MDFTQKLEIEENENKFQFWQNWRAYNVSFKFYPLSLFFIKRIEKTIEMIPAKQRETSSANAFLISVPSN